MSHEDRPFNLDDFRELTAGLPGGTVLCPSWFGAPPDDGDAPSIEFHDAVVGTQGGLPAVILRCSLINPEDFEDGDQEEEAGDDDPR